MFDRQQTNQKNSSFVRKELLIRRNILFIHARLISQFIHTWFDQLRVGALCMKNFLTVFLLFYDFLKKKSRDINDLTATWHELSDAHDTHYILNDVATLTAEASSTASLYAAAPTLIIPGHPSTTTLFYHLPLPPPLPSLSFSPLSVATQRGTLETVYTSDLNAVMFAERDIPCCQSRN